MAMRPSAVFASAAIVGAVALGGTTWAYAQEDSTTTTTPSTDDTTADDDTTTRDENCPEKGAATEAEASVAS